MKTSRTTHCAVAAVATLARLALNYANLITKPSASQPHTHSAIRRQVKEEEGRRKEG